MVAHRQLVIGLVLYCSSFVEVFAESIDELSAHCSLPDAQQHSQGEALLQVEFQRTAPHQQQYDKTKTSPQVLKLSSHGLGAEKAATKTSKNKIEEPGPGDDKDINESEKEEKTAVEKAEEGEIYSESDQMGDTASENDEDHENTEGEEMDRRDETQENQETERDQKNVHGDKKGKTDKSVLLVVDEGKKGNKEAIEKKKDPKDPTNSNDEPPGQEPKRSRGPLAQGKDPTNSNDEPPGQEPKRGKGDPVQSDHDEKSNNKKEHHEKGRDKTKKAEEEKTEKKRVPPNLENMRHDE